MISEGRVNLFFRVNDLAVNSIIDVEARTTNLILFSISTGIDKGLD